MKKFMKGCGITALVMLVVGFILAAVAGAVRGRTGILDVVEAATGGKVHLNVGNWNFPWGFGWFGDWIGDLTDDWSDEVSDLADDWSDSVSDFADDWGNGFDIQDATIFESGYDILKGNVDKYSLGSDVTDLDIEVGGCRFETRYSGDDSFYLEARKIGKLQGYVKGDTLYVKSVNKVKHWDDAKSGSIILYIPEGYVFDCVDMELGAGVMKIEELAARKTELEVGAGQITVERIRAEELKATVGMGGIEMDAMDAHILEAEIGMGSLEVKGQIGRSADVECSMGSVDMTLSGSQKDYNYQIESAMGSVELGSMRFSGLGQERYIDNGADRDITVECSMGGTVIKFRE